MKKLMNRLMEMIWWGFVAGSILLGATRTAGAAYVLADASNTTVNASSTWTALTRSDTPVARRPDQGFNFTSDSQKVPLNSRGK